MLFMAFQEAKTHTLHFIHDTHYQLCRPIVILTDLDEAGYLVYDEDNMTYGLGSSIEEATSDYQQSLIIDLELLLKDRDVLSPALRERLNALERHIQPRDAAVSYTHLTLPT